ncbi:MAG: amino acid racemase [Acidobacteria bacterium]|nr:amino acid racemase [Acidobacteriota bacterium]
MPDRIIGILGGMGPEATADFFREIIQLTPASRDQDHIPVLIYSNTRIPDRTAAILEGGEDPLPLLIDSAKVLERAGAGIITMPCNTAHLYVESLRRATAIPVLHMIDETVRELRSRYPELRSVGLLATTGTIRAGIYQSALGAAGIAAVVPEEPDQDRIMAVIRDIKADRNRDEARRSVKRICLGLAAQGAEAVILGCTELPLVLDTKRPPCPLLNPTRILAQAAVKWARGGAADD